jgi:hypothetical protein
MTVIDFFVFVACSNLKCARNAQMNSRPPLRIALLAMKNEHCHESNSCISKLRMKLSLSMLCFINTCEKSGINHERCC